MGVSETVVVSLKPTKGEVAITCALQDAVLALRSTYLNAIFNFLLELFGLLYRTWALCHVI